MAQPAPVAPERQEPDNFIAQVDEELDIFQSSPDEGWGKHNLLSLDGGGIRGLWSLFVLERLMENVAEEEESLDDETLHSFSPEPWPSSLKQDPVTQDERQRYESANTPARQFAALAKTRRYFPCHYFDYIGGSSTGALIAIMLGRFRMCVPECQKEYRTLGEKVFGNPHTVTTLRFGIVKRPKFSAANLREVFEDVTARRSELVNQNDFEPKMTFPLKRGVCRTFVTTLKTEPGQKIIAQPYLIRSYNHVRRIKAARRTTGLSSHTGTGPASSRADTGLSGRTDEGRRTLSRRNSTDLKKAQEFEIWQVARAATAAPLYFEPLKIQMPSTQRYLLFKDGGFGDDNNPTKQGLREIKEAYGDKAIGVVVSVGTARVDKPDRNRKLFHFMPTVTELSQMANDPEKIHEEVEEMSQHDDHPFDYYRLNSPGELDVLLDEWKPKHGSPKKESGSVTIEKIQNVFNTWAGTQENIRLLQGCAERLVRRRRARILNESKWERYATGAKFTCRLKDCNTEEEFCDRQQFLDHLRRDHRVIEQGRLERIIEDSRKCWRYQ